MIKKIKKKERIFDKSGFQHVSTLGPFSINIRYVGV